MDASGVLPGLHYFGQIKNRLWAKYILDDGQKQNQADRIRALHPLRAQRHADALTQTKATHKDCASPSPTAGATA